MVLLDFEILKDEYGYYVVAYRYISGTKIVYESNRNMASLLNLFHKDYMDFIYHEFGSDEKSKDDKMHFSDYSKAEICMNGLRDLIPKAIETNNLFFAQ